MLMTLLMLIGVWDLITRTGLVSALFVPSPLSVWQAFLRVLLDGYGGHTLLYHLGSSLLRVLSGFLLACLLAVPLGLLMGCNRYVRAALEAPLDFYRPLPPLAYYTILILWLGIGNSSKIALLFLAGFPPVAINAMMAVRQVPAEYMEGARSLGAGRWQIFRYVIFPACLPGIFTGMRVGIGFTYTTLVSAEIVAAAHGIGWMVWNARRWPQSDVIFMGIIVMGLTGVMLTWLIARLERKFCPWKTTVT